MRDARRRYREYKGGYIARGRRFGIVVSRFNELFTSKLLEGAVDTLARLGARPSDVHVVHVPGAFEMPLACQKLIRAVRPDAVLTLAVVIRGETKHFDQVVKEAAKGVREVSQKTGVPVLLGMIPAENAAQAAARAGVKQTNKGREWAQAAVEMANLSRALPPKKGRR